MKRVSIILIMFMLLSKTHAQDKVKVNVGFMFNPQGGISLKKTSDLFQVYLPLYAIIPLKYQNIALTSMYSLTSNNYGGYFSHSHSVYGEYIVAIKNIKSSDSYIGVGFGKSVNNGTASVFIETGSSWKEWNPYIFLGFSTKYLLK